MIALLMGIFVASLAGSLHCAGMCGALATVSCTGCRAARQGIAAIAVYHMARGSAYAMAGAIAGSVGGALDHGGELMGVQRLAGIIAGVAVIIAGTALLMKHGGFATQARAPRSVERLLAAGHRAAMSVSPIPRAASIGALSVLLPCGWLWAFLAVAAGTGTALIGALAMIAFWAGSVPILSIVGLGAGRVGSIARGHVGALMGVAMVAIGLHTTLVAGVRSDAIAAHAPSLLHTAQADDRAENAGGFAEAEARVQAARDELPACCRGEEQAP